MRQFNSLKGVVAIFMSLLLFSFELDAQNSSQAGQGPEKAIAGIVQESATKEPLPGVAIKNLRTNQIVASDLDGNFTIKARKGDALLLTSIGMKDLTYVVADVNSKAIVEMEEDAISLNDVVVTGYQTLSKERSTGSYAVVSSDKLESKLQPNLKSIMEGKSAGVVLTKDGDLEIRGVSTINGNKAPLIVVDGYPLIGEGVGIESVNPDNIANITILKDAVAASIYGARASNGVIVITTKSAKSGNFSINYKGTYSVTLKPDLTKLNLASVEDYMEAEKDLYDFYPNGPFIQWYVYNHMTDYQWLLLAKDKGMMSEAEANAQIEQLRNNNALNQIEKYLIRPKQSQQHNLAISSSTETNNLNAAIRYSKDYGNVKHNSDQRLIFDLNNTWKPKEWISLRVFANVNYTENKGTEEGWERFTSFRAVDKILPYTKLYDENGNILPWKPVGQRRMEKYETYPGMKPVDYHPETDMALNPRTTQNIQLRMGGDVNVKFCKFLNGSVGGSWIRGASTYKAVSEAESFKMRTMYNDGTSASNPTKHYIPEGGMIDETHTNVSSWVFRGQLNYKQSFNNEKHRVSVLAGSEISKDTYNTTFMPTRFGYDPVSATYNSGFDALAYNNNTGDIYSDMLFGKAPQGLWKVNLGDNYRIRDNRFVSWYGNASYEFNNRYILTGSIRLDLTNFFGTDPKYRYKPTWSVGGTWKVAEENFFEGIKDKFNRLDVRLSYGVNGNISLNYTPFLILGVGEHDQEMGGVSNSINSYPNNQLRWERTNVVDFGIDAGFLNNRINLGVDYYHKKSTDLIVKDAVDETTGVSSLPQNVGGVTNQGVELTIDADAVRTNDFTWNTSLILSYNKSNVDQYNIQRKYYSSYAIASPILVEGYPMDGFWGGKFAGLSNKGVSMFYNHKGEKVEGGSLKAEDAVYLGSYRPKTDLSWTNSFSWKGLEASFMFIAKFGAKYRKDCFSGSNYNNRHVGERWRQPGDEEHTIYPMLKSWNMDIFYFPYGDVLVGNANYLKLRDLTVGYNLPKKTVNKIGLQGLKFYFQTRNLFYITAKGVDIDPETAELNTSNGTGSWTAQGYTSLQLRPEFYIGLSITL